MFCVTADRKIKYFVAPSTNAKMNHHDRHMSSDAVVVGQALQAV